jgi:hypothetical protein
VPEVPEAQTFAADSAETAVGALEMSAITAAGVSGIAEPANSGARSPEALAQAARANQSSFQRPGDGQFSRIERIRRQLSPRSFWPDRLR